MDFPVSLMQTIIRDAIREQRIAERKVVYSTKEVMKMFDYEDYNSFIEYTEKPDCLLRKAKGRRGKWTAKSVDAEELRINQ